jgi:hypothetical protein
MDISASDVADMILPDGRKGGRTDPNHYQRKQRPSPDKPSPQEAAHRQVCTILGLNNGVVLRLGAEAWAAPCFFCGNQMTSTSPCSCVGHTFERNYENAEHISNRKLNRKESMAMTYNLVVSSLKALSKSDFKVEVLGMKQIEGEWRWRNGDAL